MTLKRDIELISGGLVDLHVGLKRARHFAGLLHSGSGHEGDTFWELDEVFNQMTIDIERLMEEVK